MSYEQSEIWKAGNAAERKFMQAYSDRITEDIRDEHGGTDFVLDGNVRVDVKLDRLMHMTGSIPFEVAYFTEERCGHGWAMYSDADYIVFYCPEREHFYWVSLPALRRLVYERGLEMDAKAPKTRMAVTDQNKVMLLFPVRLETLRTELNSVEFFVEKA